MVGSFVVLYLFLGGCGAAVVLVAAIWSLLFGRTRTRTAEQTRAFTALRARLFAAGLVLLVLGSLCLLLDLGRPERFILLFVCPTASVISAGTFLLSGCILAAALLAVADFALVRWMSRGARRVLEAAAAALACGVMLYTGLYMAWLEAVPLWNNAALPVLLALSSASSGAAVVMLAVPFGRDWRLLSGWVRALRRAHCAVLVLEALALAAFFGDRGSRSLRGGVVADAAGAGRPRAVVRRGLRCSRPPDAAYRRGDSIVSGTCGSGAGRRGALRRRWADSAVLPGAGGEPLGAGDTMGPATGPGRSRARCREGEEVTWPCSR